MGETRRLCGPGLRASVLAVPVGGVVVILEHPANGQPEGAILPVARPTPPLAAPAGARGSSPGRFRLRHQSIFRNGDMERVLNRHDSRTFCFA